MIPRVCFTCLWLLYSFVISIVFEYTSFHSFSQYQSLLKASASQVNREAQTDVYSHVVVEGVATTRQKIFLPANIIDKATHQISHRAILVDKTHPLPLLPVSVHRPFSELLSNVIGKNERFHKKISAIEQTMKAG